MRLEMLHFILLLALAYDVLGEVVESELEFKENSDYVFTKTVFGGIKYVTVDGVHILNPDGGSHCVQPNDCWEIIKGDEHLIANGYLKGFGASFTVQPLNANERSPVGVQYKMAGAPDYPHLPLGTRSIIAKELLENERLIHILLFSTEIGSVHVTGNITTDKVDFNIITMMGKTGLGRTDLLFFTGHVGTTTREVRIYHRSGRVDRIRIQPSRKPWATVPILTFVDFERAFTLH